MLDRLPAGTSVFIDTNAFLYHFLNLKPSCTELLFRAKRGDIRASTSTIALSEVSHQLMLSEVGAQRPVTPGGALRFLRRHPEVIRTLTKTPELIRLIGTWRIRILPLQWRDVRLATELMLRYQLMTTDALIAATMQRYHINHLVSNDSDFARVPTITLWTP